MKHTCCNVKDSRGKMIHVGDEVLRVSGDVMRPGETGFVHDTSNARVNGVRIRISDNQHEKEIGDFIWSAWVKPSEVRVIESKATP